MIDTVLRLTLAGTATGLLLLGLTRVFKKMPRCWAYYLRLPVLLRFLIPVGFTAIPLPSLPVSADSGAIYGTGAPAPQPDGVTILPSGELQELEADAAGTPAGPETGKILFALWLSGAVISAAARLLELGLVSRRLRRSRKFILRHGGIPVFESGSAATPLLTGLIRPVIYVPAGLSREELKMALAHEETHARRLDLWYKWLVQLTVSIHWFNPAVYLVSREIARLCELSCDEAVIKKLDAAGKKSYALLLLNLAEMNSPMVVQMAGGTNNRLRERITSIMKERKISRPVIAAAICITAAVALAAVFTGAFVSASASAGGAPENAVQSAAPEVSAAESAAPSHSTGGNLKTDEEIIAICSRELQQLKALGVITADISLAYQDQPVSHSRGVEGFSVTPGETADLCYTCFTADNISGWLELDLESGKIVYFFAAAAAGDEEPCYMSADGVRQYENYGDITGENLSDGDIAALLCTYWDLDSAELIGYDEASGSAEYIFSAAGQPDRTRYITRHPSEAGAVFGFGYAHPLG